ncbi:MAG: T9SS type A sorting domain-containing protein [Bacteroidota bacterium]|nr:T9SS type A sorting domain-containing protein [Bacteroidota bacterium]
MKIVKLLAIIICILLVDKSEAQPFSVGDTTCNYTVLHHTIYPLTGQIPSATGYSLDVDGDLTNDIVFNWVSNGSSVGSSAYSACRLTCTSPSNYEFVYQQTPTNCLNPPVVLPSNLPLFTSFNQNLNWNTNVPNSYIYDFHLPQYFAGYQCGHYSSISITDVFIGFRKILINDTIYGWLRLKTHVSAPITQIVNDEIVSYALKHTSSNTLTSVFTNTTTNICAGNFLSLSASPPGGIFYGSGVSGNVFNSAITGPGIQTLYYSKSCAVSMYTIIVDPTPTPAFTNSLASVCNGESLTLTAMPAGGIFSGPGISGNTFNSSVTGLGFTPATYSYTNSFGCSNTTNLNINVVTVPSLTLTSSYTLSCPGTPLTLTALGATNFTWSNGSTNQSIVVSPTTSTNYSVTGEFATGNCPSATANLFQPIGNPTITIVAPSLTSCPGQTVTNISANGATSYLWSNNLTTFSISINPTVTTTYSVIGYHPGGCSDTAYFTQTVLVPPTLTLTWSKPQICPGDSITLFINGGTGIYQLLDGNYLPVVPSTTLSYIIITPTASVTYFIRDYYSTINTSCYVEDYVPYLSLVYCVGIKEISNEGSYLKTFPNPNNGEFEIKGVNQETIFITNELGQLIATANLNSENNFTYKIDNLNNGIYFVGNKFVKQKIVVIK